MSTGLYQYRSNFHLLLCLVAACFLIGCEKTEKKNETIPPGLSKKMMSQMNRSSIEALTDYLARRIDPDVNYYKRAALYFNSGDYEHAMRDVNDALENKDNVGEYYLLRSKIYRELNNMEDALHDAQRAEALTQNSTDLYIVLADLLQEKKEYAQAGRYLNRALNMDPYNGNTFYVRGKLQLHSGDTLSALTSLQQSIQFNPRMLRAYQSSALVFSALGDYASASRIIDQSIKYFPSNSDLLLAKGDIYFKQNRSDSAIYFYQKTILMNPKRIDAHLRKANVYLTKWKSHYLAMITFMDIKAIDPNYEEINIRIAQAYEGMSNYFRAKEYYTLELEKFPESKPARYGLWKIRQRESGLLNGEDHDEAGTRKPTKTLDSLKLNIVPLERQKVPNI